MLPSWCKTELMRKFYLSFLILAFTVAAPAQDADNSSHPIDTDLAECKKEAGKHSAEKHIQCEYTARIAWEKEIDKYYGLLIGAVKPDAKKLLKTAQKNWIAYRDEEMAFTGSLYKNMESKAWLVIHAARLTTLMRTRALELQEYYEMATFDPD